MENILPVYELCSVSILVMWSKKMVSNFEVKLPSMNVLRPFWKEGRNLQYYVLSLWYLCSVRAGLGHMI